MIHTALLNSALHLILSWSSVLGVVIVPFCVGIAFEQKLAPATREPGSRLPRRY